MSHTPLYVCDTLKKLAKNFIILETKSVAKIQIKATQQKVVHSTQKLFLEK